MVKILLQSILVTIFLLILSVKTMDWAELAEVLDQAQEASTAGTRGLESSDNFRTTTVTQYLESNNKSFKEELQSIWNEINFYTLGEQIYLKNKLSGIQNLIEKILRDPEDNKYGEKKSFGTKESLGNASLSNMRSMEIFDEVRKCLLDFYMAPKEIWASVSTTKSAIMSKILRVLDPFIKHGLISTDQAQLFFNDSEILRISAYALSNYLPVHSTYFLPSIEMVANVSGKEFVWLSMLTEPKAQFFLRHFIGFFYTHYTRKITNPEFSPIVEFFLGDSEVTGDIFNALFKVIDNSEKFYRRLDYEIERKSNFVNQALTYVQKYAPTEVKRIYTESSYDIFWKKKELLDIFCQLMPVSEAYDDKAEFFFKNRFYRSTSGKDQLEDSDDKYKIHDFERALKALKKVQEFLKNGNGKISEATTKKLSAVDRAMLKGALEFKAAVAQLSNSVKSTPASWAKEIYDWLELPNQNELLNLFQGRAFLLNEEIETLGNLKNQLLVRK
ncbi:expressed protein [Phakopsora pachyrhizi]|uniref:Expressed protein n=1 Tax=Phakopsora pachyrhizi TaxID=170000 RepID=A0AAV0B6C9_PHAPC|nr:expressed protein [Phakopsora pachyrhizi]